MEANFNHFINLNFYFNTRLDITKEKKKIYLPGLQFVINVMRASRSGNKAISSPALEPKSKALKIAMPNENTACMEKIIYIKCA